MAKRPHFPTDIILQLLAQPHNHAGRDFGHFQLSDWLPVLATRSPLASLTHQRHGDRSGHADEPLNWIACHRHGDNIAFASPASESARP
jgi:hypothetical protein